MTDYSTFPRLEILLSSSVASPQIQDALGHIPKKHTQRPGR